MATVGPGTVLPTAGVVPAPLTAIASNAHDPYTLPPRPASATPYTTAAVPTYPAYSSGAYNQAGVPTTPYGAPGGMAYGAATVAPTVQYTAPNVAAPSSYNYYPSSAQYAGAYVQPAVATGYGATPRYDRYSPSAGERFAGGMERLVGYRIGDPLVVAHGPQNQVRRSPLVLGPFLPCLTD